jgi:hypothetical protein
MPRAFVPGVLALAAFAWSADDALYRSATVDAGGQLRIVPDSGKAILLRKSKGQSSFGDPAISPDRRTVGWLAMYPDPTVTYYRGAEIPGALVLFRNGRVLHTFPTVQIFWDWQFRDGGGRVAYSTGPTHGGAAECVLRDVDSGQIVARWTVDQNGQPPAWAENLRR